MEATLHARLERVQVGFGARTIGDLPLGSCCVGGLSFRGGSYHPHDTKGLTQNEGKSERLFCDGSYDLLL